MYTLANTKASYTKAWANMVIKPHIVPIAQRSAQKIINNKARYQVLEQVTGVPWYFIGLLHMRESNFNFETHLHNGDPLNVNGKFKRTTRVPAKRPVAGPKNGVTYTFEESAIDALTYEFGHVKEWSIEQIAFFQEKYNGFGPRMRGYPSGYLWSGSNQYTTGKFIFDGPKGWRPNVVDQQLGAMVVLKCLLDMENITIGNPIPEAPVLDPDVPVPGEDLPLSPSADPPKPTNKEMRKVSRKFNVITWLKSIFGWTTGVTVTAKTLDVTNIVATKTYIDTLKVFISDYGIFILLFALVAGFIVVHMLQEWMKQDVQENRAIPSGLAPSQENVDAPIITN